MARVQQRNIPEKERSPFARNGLVISSLKLLLRLNFSYCGPMCVRVTGIHY